MTNGTNSMKFIADKSDENFIANAAEQLAAEFCDGLEAASFIDPPSYFSPRPLTEAETKKLMMVISAMWFKVAKIVRDNRE